MNIELHGFDCAKRLQADIWDLLRGSEGPSDAKINDCLVTVVHDVPRNRHWEDYAFIRIYSDLAEDFNIAKKLLSSQKLQNKVHRCGVECILLHSYFEL